MSDVRKHVERLMGLQEERWNDPKYNELAASSELIARAYLAECEAHERTNERLNDALKSCKERVDACSVCVGKGSVELPFDPFAEDCWQCAPYRDFLASIEQKEGVSK